MAVDGGTDVRFEADFGAGRDSVVVNQNGSYHIQREFTRPGNPITGPQPDLCEKFLMKNIPFTQFPYRLIFRIDVIRLNIKNREFIL